MAEPSDRTRDSEAPPDDLKRERDAFLQQFFRKGAQLTEELLRENEKLRGAIAELEHEADRMRAHLASDSAIRELLKKIEELEVEKRELMTRSVRMKELTDQHSRRFAEVEAELGNLASLHIAGAQLHSGRSARGVLRSAKELLAQLVGAETFGIYWVSDDKKTLVAIAGEGLDAGDLPVGQGPWAEPFAKGEVVLCELDDTAKGTIERPAAVVPLLVDGRPLGLILVASTLEQKSGFGGADYELFRLLSQQLASAVVHAKLFSDVGRAVPPLTQLVEKES